MDARAIAAWFTIFDWSPTDPRWEQRRKAFWAWRKSKKARRWARVLARIPFVRLIAIGNTLGYGNCSEESDIDFVIVTAPHRIWFVRFCIITLLRLFRQRPGEHSRDAICSSFFLTTEAMNLETLQIEYPVSSIQYSVFPSDPYLLFWVTQLTVLFDRDGTYAAFWRANEEWVQRWLPDARPRAAHPRLNISPPPAGRPPARLPARRVQPGGGLWLGEGSACPSKLQRRRERGRGSRVIGRFLSGRLGDTLEHWCCRFQERRLSSRIRVLANRDSRVVISDRMLKFHTNDRRKHFRDLWITKMQVTGDK